MDRSASRGVWQDERGVSLTELVVVLVILAVIAGGILAVWTSTQQSYFVGARITQLQGDVRVALDQVAHDIRKAGRDITNAGVIAVPTATATSIEVRMDLDDDGATTGANEDVTYTLSGTQLMRKASAAGTAQPLADNVSTVSFTYWWAPVVGASCGAGTLSSGQSPSAAQRNCLRRVRVSLTGQSTVNTSQGPQTLSKTVTTDVDVRTR